MQSRRKLRKRRQSRSRPEELGFNWQVSELERRLLLAADLQIEAGTSVTAQFNDASTPLDIAQLDRQNETVRVYLGRDLGVPTTEVFSEAAASQLDLSGRAPVALVAGDFDGDDATDLAVGHGTGVSVFLNNGQGAFQESTEHFVSIDGGVTGPGALIAGDFDGDGGDDLAVLSEAITVTPLPAFDDIGSALVQVRSTSVRGAIGPNGDVDTFTFSVEAEQVLSLEVDPSDGLRPAVEVYRRTPCGRVGTGAAEAVGRSGWPEPLHTKRIARRTR